MPGSATMVQKGQPTKLQHSYGLSPITALAFYRASPDHVLLLAGEDTWLKVYDAQRSRLLGQLKVFYSQPIHGIHVSESTQENLSNGEDGILIWGGQSVTILPQTSLQALINGSTPLQPIEFKAPDWIYDGILFPDANNKNNNVTGALVTAHNEILPLSVTPDNTTLTFGPLTSPSRPILYSANLCCLSPGVVLVAGGTVFGEIIVWKYYTDSAVRPSQWEVLFVFTGHEGSIFGVSISNEIVFAPGVKGRLLASCSDDRTIRVWDITDRDVGVTAVGEGAGESEGFDSRVLGEARETGFGGNSEVRRENRNDSSRCVAVAMGHVSRIWHVKFGGQADGSPIEVYSFGEDCSRQRWELSLDLERWNGSAESAAVGSIGSLRLCGANTSHSGKNIWSAAVLGRGQEEPLIATGGADGRIVVSGRIKDTDSVSPKPYEDLDLSLTYDEVLQNLGTSHASITEPQSKKNVKHAFQRYAFLSDQRLMATTSSGRLFLAIMGESAAWEELALPEVILSDLRSWNVVKSPARDTALLGSATGKVYLFREGHEVRELAQFPRKISDIILLDSSPVSRPQESQPQPWSVIVTVLGLDHALILDYDPTTDTATVSPRRILLPEHYILTAATFCNPDTLILGSRTGVITLCTPHSDTTHFTPVTSRKDPKTKDAITCLLPLPGPSPTTSFLATCRDGKYRIYTLSPSLQLQHETSPPLTTIESAFFTTTSPQKAELILHGFHTTSFQSYNATALSLLASIPCGGAHRPFASLSPSSDAGQLRVAFPQAGKVRIYSQGAAGERVVVKGGHGREVKAVAASSSSSQGGYIATGAEDTSLRIWKPTPSSSSGRDEEMDCLAVVQGHSAGIQALRWSDSRYLFSSAGSEELFVWRVGSTTSTTPSDEGSYAALAVMREAVWDNKTRDGDLRIVDFDVSPWGATDDGEVLVTMGLSDSSIRAYVYTPAGVNANSEAGRFKLLACGRYTGACPTQVRHLKVDGEAGEVHVLTAFTDGHVAVWRTAAQGGEFGLALVVRLHQSSVKSLDVSSSLDEGRGRWRVVAGGDDNALGFLDLGYGGDEGGYTVLGRYRVKDAHAAAVTGLCIVKQESGVTEVATASNDQRVKLWRAEPNVAGGIRVSLLDNRYSAVADAGDLELISLGKLMVGGVGMEVWDVSER